MVYIPSQPSFAIAPNIRFALIRANSISAAGALGQGQSTAPDRLMARSGVCRLTAGWVQQLVLGKLLTFVSFRREECESFGVSASSPIDLAPFLGSFHCSLLTAHSPSHLTTHHSPLTTHHSLPLQQSPGQRSPVTMLCWSRVHSDKVDKVVWIKILRVTHVDNRVYPLVCHEQHQHNGTPINACFFLMTIHTQTQTLCRVLC